MLRRLLAVTTPLLALLVAVPAAGAATCYGSLFVGDAGGGVDRVTDLTASGIYFNGRVAIAGAGPLGPIVPARDGQRVFVADLTGQRVLALDASTLAVLGSAAVGNPGGPSALALTPDGRHLLVANAGAGTITSLLAADLSVVQTTARLTGGTISALAVAPDGTRVLAGEAAGTGVDGTAMLTGSLRDGIVADVTSIPVGIAGAEDRVSAIAPSRTGAALLVAVASQTGAAILRMDPAYPHSSTAAYAQTGAAFSLMAVPSSGPALVVTSGGNAIGLADAAGGTLAPAWSPLDLQEPIVGLGALADGTALMGLSAGNLHVIPADGTASSVAALPNQPLGAGTALAVCPRTPPDPPADVRARPGDGAVTVGWAAPANDGGLAITRYVATASPGGATCETDGATACTIAGLRNGTAYAISMTAANALGTGPTGAPAARVTPRRNLAPSPLADVVLVATPKRRVIAISARATVDGRGRLAIAVVRGGRAACSRARAVAGAGTYRVTCVLGAAERDLLRRARLQVRVHVTFTPRNGIVAADTRSLTIPRRR